MLNIKTAQSKNECYISGILNELEIVEGSNTNGEYVRGVAKIRVDQEVDGKLQENIIPVSMYASKFKSNGELSKVYSRILEYRENLTSVAAAEDISQASRVTISGKSCNIKENMWYDNGTNSVKSVFRISSNFINAQKNTDEEKATFELNGVVLKTRPETDKDGNETGRLIVSLGVVGYEGRLDVIELIAKDNPKAHIEANWADGDTVNVSGIINLSSKVVTWEEPQGFGPPVKRTRTESCRELIIIGGSAGGLDESKSYDSSEVKAALANRKNRMEELKENAKSKPAAKANTTGSFGF